MIEARSPAEPGVSDRIVVEVTQEPGKSFLHRMIALVEGTERRKTPNEIALCTPLAALTLGFVFVMVSLRPFAPRRHRSPRDDAIALLVALIPTTIGALLSAIGSPAWTAGSAATSSPSPAAPSRLPGTATCCCSTRPARSRSATARRWNSSRCPASRWRSWPRRRRCPRSPTRPRRALDRGPRQELRHPRARLRRSRAELRPVHRRDPDERRRLQRHPAAQGRRRRDRKLGRRRGRAAPAELGPSSTGSAARAAPRSPSPATSGCSGSIYLKDVIKEGMNARFDQLRAMGIRTIMVTGDNKLTAAKIAEEAGVDDFLAEATPGAQARADQGAAGRRAADRDDRRRHQRRPGAGPGRRRRGDEHRHPGRARGRQHGRPRLQPDEADRDRRGRQAAADHPRRPDHVLDRQRRRQVLRDPAGDVRRHLRPLATAGRSTPST